MTYDEAAALIASGDWREDVLAENESAMFPKNINKYKSFMLDAYFVNEAGEQTLCGKYFFDRDYINKWSITSGNYAIKGNFGDGNQLVITDRVIDEAGEYSNLIITKVRGFRPVRKVIYVYKVDATTYLVTSDAEDLYTSEGLRLAAAEETVVE